MLTQMTRPTPVPFEVISGIGGTSYTADAGGVVAVTQQGDVSALFNAGFIFVGSGPSTRNNFRNFIDGGDFTVNPFQRNIPGLASANVIAAAITNTVTYFADRFFGVGGASSAILFSLVADTTIAGFSQALKFQRQSTNANLAVINMGQVLETADCVHLQGQKVTLSFWVRSGANFSAAGGLITVQLVSGTGTNQSAANLIAGSWTGATNVINATQAITSTMTRYSFTGTVPVGCTQLGFVLNFTPVGTAGADDSVVINGVQLEAGAVATDFERRDLEVELALCQRYCYVVPEPASGVIVAVGSVSATNTELFGLPTPTPLRAAPTVTVTVGSFKSNSSTAGIVAATALAGTAAHTATMVGLTSTGTGTAGQAALLQGGGGAGFIVASADF